VPRARHAGRRRQILRQPSPPSRRVPRSNRHRIILGWKMIFWYASSRRLMTPGAGRPRAGAGGGRHGDDRGDGRRDRPRPPGADKISNPTSAGSGPRHEAMTCRCRERAEGPPPKGVTAAHVRRPLRRRCRPRRFFANGFPHICRRARRHPRLGVRLSVRAHHVAAPSPGSVTAAAALSCPACRHRQLGDAADAEADARRVSPFAAQGPRVHRGPLGGIDDG